MKPFVVADWEMEMPDFEDRVCIMVDKFDIDNPKFRNSTYKVFVQGAEPPQISDPERLYKIADQFDLILTWNEETLKRYPQAVFFAFGTCWIPRDHQKMHPKTKALSIIASEKRFLEGHKLRHEIVEKFKDRMDVFGRAYKYVESKTEALDDYMFSIVIENVRINDYFTEKLIDCLRTGTVPIHWGTLNIDKYFDPDGFIFFEDAEEIGNILNTLTLERYQKMLPIVQKNFDLAAEYARPYEERIYEKVAEFISKNPKKEKSLLSRFFSGVKK